MGTLFRYAIVAAFFALVGLFAIGLAVSAFIGALHIGLSPLAAFGYGASGGVLALNAAAELVRDGI